MPREISPVKAVTIIFIINAKNNKRILRILTIVMMHVMIHINQKSALAKPFPSILQTLFHLIFRTTL